MAIEIVSVPIKNGDFPYFFVCLPEGKSWSFYEDWMMLDGVAHDIHDGQETTI